MTRINEYFDSSEFACHCGNCTSPMPDQKLIDLVTDIRKMLRQPMTIMSGYRCPEHNAKVGGVKDSAHTLGLAVDVFAPNSGFMYQLLRCSLLVGAKRIGIGKDFLHIDVDDSKPQYVIWTYYKEA